MSTLASLKLTAQRRPHQLPAAMQRRNKLLGKLADQLALARAQQAGTAFEATKRRTVVDATTGQRQSMAVPRRVRPWWFHTDNGRLALTVRYGSRVLELAKGKSAIDIADQAALIAALEVLVQAVSAGELDAAIEVAVGQTRRGFKA